MAVTIFIFLDFAQIRPYFYFSFDKLAVILLTYYITKYATKSIINP